MPLIITPSILNALFQNFNFIYNEGLKGTPVHWGKVAMEQPSSTAEEIYPWLGQAPNLREWVGDRFVNGLEAHAFTIKNLKFESTVSIPRTQIEDDRMGVYKGAFTNMGRMVAQHPDRLVFGLLKDAFARNCYDGQFFFDTDHPTRDESDHVVSVSNMQPGSGPAWFLLDTTQLTSTRRKSRQRKPQRKPQALKFRRR